MAPGRVDKLWSYAGLTRLWSWCLIGCAAAMAVLSVALQASERSGLSSRWIATALGMTGITGVVFYPLLRVWLKRAALPSLRLETAEQLKGSRLLEAGPGDWRRWSVIIALVLLAGSMMMLTFLIGVLGGGGTAEGVVVGTLLAWGVVTLEDARRIQRAEREQKRRFFASCDRPVAIGERVVWTAQR